MSARQSSRTARLAVVLSLAIVTPSLADAQAQTSPRALSAVGYYDSAIQRVVVVGGDGELRAGDRHRVWSWTGSLWQLVTDSGPTARGNAGAAYDARLRRAVVTGGAARSATGSTFVTLDDTWEGTATGWRPLAGTNFPARDHQSMVYDETHQAILMFGGIAGTREAPWPNDTWELRPDGWARVSTDGPQGRGRAGLVYDKGRRQVVLFGGVGAPPAPRQPQPFFNDTWVWENGSWRKVAEGGPRGRYAHGMVYDERAGVVLMYSGAAAHSNAPLSDMWQWDGTRWTEIRLTGPTPGFRYQPIMAYDRARGRTVLYGGNQLADDDTWEWDGQRWTQIRQ